MSTSEEEKKDERLTKEGKPDKRPLFKPGQSGNPKGRPRGSKNRSTVIKAAIEGAMLDRLEEDAVAVLEKTIDMAKKGDRTCIKILMDRLLPARRAEDTAKEKGSGAVSITINSLNDSGGKSTTTIQGEYKEDNDDS